MPTHQRNIEYGMARRGRDRRLQLGLMQKEVAARMNRKPEWVSRLEIDGAATMVVIRAWAKALEMKPSELAFGEDE